VLEAKAVAAMLLFPAWQGFNAKAHAEGTSFAHLGEQQFDERIDLWDDGTDPRSLGRAYDAEGTPKRRVDLVRAGVTVGLVHDRRSAALAGVEPTGSSIGSEAFGGYPGDLFLGAGDDTVEALVAGVERGLLVTDLWYNRILDPKTQVVTGLTRNGLFLIEGGEVTRPVQNLRYTQSVVGALAPGHVLGIGDDGQLVSNEGGVAHVPSLRLAAWAFTGNAQG
jgi:predicted Zn-dependent protease